MYNTENEKDLSQRIFLKIYQFNYANTLNIVYANVLKF